MSEYLLITFWNGLPWKMVTIKQVETLCCVAQLGSFNRAAARLHTTQSAISKRIQELESTLGFTLFNRIHRHVTLTSKGQEILALGTEMLGVRDRLVQTGARREQAPKRFRLGVTELTAMTWLPRLVAEIRKAYPSIILEPKIALSAILFDRLADDSFDLVIAADMKRDARFTATHLADVENCWMCSPGLVPGNRTLPLMEFGKYTVITQGSLSATGVRMDKWLQMHSVNVSRILTTNSLLMLAGLTLSGLGISCMPHAYFRDLIAAGRLKMIRTSPSPPKLSYMVFYRNDRPGAFNAQIARLCKELCDFSIRYY
ncbi:MAG: LysR family transcriptional regulator [Candidatus Korobacteraceae bacterium]